MGTLVLHGPDWTYYFNVYSARPIARLGGVFVYTRRTTSPIRHENLFIGQTSDLTKPLVPERQQCLALHGKNCLSLLIEEDERQRRRIVADILKVNAFPCNLEWVQGQAPPIRFQA